MAVDDGNDGNDGNGNYTDGGNAATVATANASAAERDSSNGSGAANGASGNAANGSANGNAEGGGSGSDSGSGEPGVEYVTYRKRDGTTGTRRKRYDARDSGSGSGNRNASGNAAANATEEAGAIGPDSVRVEPPRRTRGASAPPPNMAANTKELLQDGVSLVFWLIAKATAIPQWELPKDESKEVADKIQGFVNSLDPARAKKFERAFNKAYPAVALGGTLVAVGYPRVKMTQQIIKDRKARVTMEPQRAERSAETTGNAASPDTAPAPTGSAKDITELVAVPLTATDLGKIGDGFTEYPE
jgi:hypothetical protein